jgi:RNA polymerase subunit RPABC4/transcription elongation factor Spt4
MAGFGPLAPPGPQILAPPPPPPPPTWHCPACRKESPAAGFCTEDGIELANGPPPPPARQILFLACPKCGRAYSRDSKFCPNDRELLLPYGMGMNDYRARHKSDPVPAQRVCPKCGRVSAGTARFCPNEGEPLPT